MGVSLYNVSGQCYNYYLPPKGTTMKAYEILTGELVLVYAESEEEAMDKLADGDYEEIECLSEVQRVYKSDNDFENVL
jgi:hypothetical protein